MQEGDRHLEIPGLKPSSHLVRIQGGRAGFVVALVAGAAVVVTSMLLARVILDDGKVFPPARFGDFLEYLPRCYSNVLALLGPKEAEDRLTSIVGRQSFVTAFAFQDNGTYLRMRFNDSVRLSEHGMMLHTYTRRTRTAVFWFVALNPVWYALLTMALHCGRLAARWILPLLFICSMAPSARMLASRADVAWQVAAGATAALAAVWTIVPRKAIMVGVMLALHVLALSYVAIS